jgi:hypothetical protein
MTTRRARLCVATAAAALMLALSGADDAAKSMKADELSFEVPSTWKSETVKSKMRKAQLKVDPAEGDTEPAEMVLFVFPNGAGTVEANIKRWESQFVDADGKAPKAKVEEKKGKNVDVTRVEVAGRYVAAVTPGAAEKYDKPGFTLLGAIVQTPAKGYFFRMVGPDKTVKAAGKGFDAMIGSMSKSEE